MPLTAGHGVSPTKGRRAELSAPRHRVVALVVRALLGIPLVFGCETHPSPASDHRADARESAVTYVLPDAGEDILSPDFIARARAARDAAKTVASVCGMSREGYNVAEDFFDGCLYREQHAKALHKATAALLDAGLDAGLVPETGPGASFVAEVRMFDAFVLEVDRKRPENLPESGRLFRSRGTLAHYQDLATAWNAMVPSEPTPVDVGTFDFPYDAGPGPIRWTRCAGLACFRP